MQAMMVQHGNPGAGSDTYRKTLIDWPSAGPNKWVNTKLRARPSSEPSMRAETGTNQSINLKRPLDTRCNSGRTGTGDAAPWQRFLSYWFAAVRFLVFSQSLKAKDTNCR